MLSQFSLEVISLLAFNMAKDRDYFAFLMQAGAGKTPTTITTIKYKWAMSGGILPTLIFCPVITLDNWRNEFTTWTRLDKKYIGVVKGTPKKRIEVINNPGYSLQNYTLLPSIKNYTNGHFAF